MKGYKWMVWLILFAGSMIKLSAQSYIQFIENKGQWHPQIAFKGEIAAGSFILKPDGGFRVIQHNHKDLQAIAARFHGSSATKTGNNSASKMTEMASSKLPPVPFPINPSSLGLHSHAYEVTFLNANPHPVAVPDKALATYNNYFIGNDPSKWASGCKIYQAVTYKNIYPNIDVRYYTNNTGQLKYDIIVNPGGDVEKIALYYDGVDALKLKEGALLVKNSINDVTEMAPESYTIAEAGRKEVNCSYDLKGNIVRFKMGAFSKANTLVIDPTEIFCSFSGSRADNWGYTATYDALGNFYSGGIVFATGYPVTNGSSFKGGNNNTGEGSDNTDVSGFDIGVMKFNASGTAVLYATYIGGANGNEQPHSLIVNSAGNLIIAGRTTSFDYPTKNALNGLANVVGSGLSTSSSTDQDIVITELNATGTLVGSIRIGGTGDDGVNVRTKDNDPRGTLSLRRNYGDDARGEVTIDAGGNIYLVSCTQSSDFPTVNPFQNSNNGGGAFALNSTTTIKLNQDAVVLKLSPDLSSVIFSSYLGGTGEDAAFALSLHPTTNDIYVAGATASSDFPGAVNAYTGGIDGFVAIIKNSATPSLVSSKYFGTASADLLYGIQFNATGNPFVMGTSEGVMPIVTSPFNTAEGQATGHQFIMKLSGDLASTIYSVNFGPGSTMPNISPTAFLVDRCENVYVSGWGGGLDGDYANSGTNGLIAKKAPDGTQPLKTTTDGDDFYFFVLARFAASQLYGGFFGQTDPHTNPPQSTPDHVDGGTSRFDKNGIIYQAICANCGGNVTFPVTPGAAYTSNGAITTSNGVVTTSQNGFGCNLASLKIAFNLAGLASGLRSSINGVIRDTVGCVPLTAEFTDTVGAGKQYIWDFGDGTSRDTTLVDSVSHRYTAVGLYKVMLISVDSLSCNISDTSYVSMKVRNDPATLALSDVKLAPCTAFNYQFNNTSTGSKSFGNSSFRIDYGDGKSDIMGTGLITHNYPAIGTYHVGLVLLDTNYCNQADTISLTLNIAANVKAQFTTPPFGCIPYTAVFINTSIGGLQYKWDYGDGIVDSTTTLANMQHLYPTVGTYTIHLVANDSSTCNKTNTAVFTISTLAKPIPGFTASPQPPITNQAIIFTNTSTGGTSYKWLFGDGDSLVTTSYAAVSHIYEASGTFNACLIVINQAGCSDTICQSVQAIIKPLFDVPNAFSPNGDGVNDMIFVKGFGIAQLKWNIYNRWGILVFQTSDKNTGWDGMYKGRLQPEDVYHYVVEIKMSDGTKYVKKGDITLLK